MLLYKNIAYPNNTSATYDYDSLNRLTYLENKGPQSVFGSYRYTLGAAGNRLQIVENNGDTNDYQYDRLNRLTRESRTGEHAYWIEYQYDPFGNRLQMNQAGAITTYAYDDNDRLLTETAQSDVTTYTYDNNGSTTSKIGPAEEWIYSWNDDNKLAGATLNGQLAADYQYDVDGERVTKSFQSGATHFLVDINNQTGYSQVLRETDQSNIQIVSYAFGDDLISQDRGEPNFYHYDGLGSTRELASAQGIVTDSYDYLAFGDILDKSGSSLNNNLYTGEYFDQTIDNFYLRARYYNSDTGSFLNMDPFYIPTGANLYIYVNDNPINFIDPAGLYGEKVHKEATGYWMKNHPPKWCGNDINEAVARGNINIDKLHRLEWPRHFTNYGLAIGLIRAKALENSSMSVNRAYEFGQALHTFQDSFSHCLKLDPSGSSCNDVEGHMNYPVTGPAFKGMMKHAHYCDYVPKDVKQNRNCCTKRCDLPGCTYGHMGPCKPDNYCPFPSIKEERGYEDECGGGCDLWKTYDYQMREESLRYIQLFKLRCTVVKLRKIATSYTYSVDTWMIPFTK